MAPSPRPSTHPEVVAAGAVVGRKCAGVREVLLVHRPKYDDWSFPKGKQEPGEHVTVTAVREVEEETGVPVRLGRPLPPQCYADARGREKKVHYWVGHVVDEPRHRAADNEIDEVRWFPVEKAARRLTYLDDRSTLEHYLEEPRRTTPLLVLRHAAARKRESWRQPDPLRPLTRDGHAQAVALIPLLAAYGVTTMLTSSNVRCVQTVEPYATAAHRHIDAHEDLSEEAYDEARASELVGAILAGGEPAVLCAHRPQLPHLLSLLGVEEEPLAKGELVVCHHRKGRVLATERHLPC